MQFGDRGLIATWRASGPSAPWKSVARRPGYRTNTVLLLGIGEAPRGASAPLEFGQFPSRFRKSDGRGRPSHIVVRASPPALREVQAPPLQVFWAPQSKMDANFPGCRLRDTLGTAVLRERCKPRRFAYSGYRSSIGTNFFPTGSPVYWLSGLYNLLSASCSSTCAVQPAVREMAKIGVKRSVGMPSE
jgi:hypothetical protein